MATLTMKAVNNAINAFANTKAKQHDHFRGILSNIDEIMTFNPNDFTLWRNVANKILSDAKGYTKETRELLVIVKNYLGKHTPIRFGKADDQGNRFHIVGNGMNDKVYVTFETFLEHYETPEKEKAIKPIEQRIDTYVKGLLKNETVTKETFIALMSLAYDKAMQENNTVRNVPIAPI